MSQEAVPEQILPEHPKGLLQQMEELMAALTADLTRLDADLQASADRLPPSGSSAPPAPPAPPAAPPVPSAPPVPPAPDAGAPLGRGR
ncbi:hypothetical protein [Streptomyces sp. NPDC015131]|uniref:hypothetical protein n=1 Tax=Streptomyces sp. NPDC015131 TaxID=3364941 RepID=UPI0036F69E0A